MADAQFVFGAHQIMLWDKDENGNLFYGSIAPEVKQALGKLNEFYNKKFIHPEFGTHDEVKATSLFTSGDAGLVFGPAWMGGWPLSDTLANVKDAVVKPYPIPSGVDGTIGRRGSAPTYGATSSAKASSISTRSSTTGTSCSAAS